MFHRWWQTNVNLADPEGRDFDDIEQSHPVEGMERFAGYVGRTGDQRPVPTRLPTERVRAPGRRP